jgi:superoxide oxidase
MLVDFSLNRPGERENGSPRAIALRPLGRERPAARAIPGAGLFGFRNASAQRLIGHASMCAADSASIDTRRPPFDSVTICFHWVTVLIVLALFTSAVLSLQFKQEDVAKAMLLQIHRSLGVTIWVTTALRLVWRQTNAKLPPFAANMTKLYRSVVPISEYSLYALLLAQPVTGLGATLFSGRPFALFWWQIPQLIAEDQALRAAFHLAHEVGAWVLGALIAGHAASGLIHHFVLRDDVLECMAPAVRTLRHRSP